MTVTMDSARVPAPERRDHARELMRQAFGLDFRVWGEWDDQHWARGTIRGLGPIQAMCATAGPARISVERRPAFIRQLRSDTYKIELLLSGDLVLAQDGREAILRPGDIAICDLTRPMCLGFPGARPTNVLALMVPRALVPLPPEQVADLTACRLSGQHGTSALLSALLQRMAPSLDQYDDADAVRISTAVVDLLVAALSKPLGQPTPQPDGSRRALLHSVYAFVEGRLGDGALTPATVAAAHHISVRYLHKLFEAEESTVAGWIRHRRLERCRRDLSDPNLRSTPVSAIGARWGFADATHFGRTFRAAHGVSPVEYRLMHGPDGTVPRTT